MSESKRASAHDSGRPSSPDEIGWDPDDAPELDERWFAEADVRSRGTLIRRGRRAGETETVVLPSALVESFRIQGADWQIRIEAALREWLAEHPERV
ncbi:BrnA antitoxin family protein [Methylobacterium sp. E-005]|uniref:BrnA antitoxin family protein n=1 Tax=Methylobacterium sp. E-005 TaxID=2836549 RepID=UPI001FBC0795|nr:BrnA antitoxin family protein [Methylobacterium sp. E-005]MCJ2090615.1 BrnA antitoxin family protein [Methylobacterium sp. E-005]